MPPVAARHLRDAPSGPDKSKRSFRAAAGTALSRARNEAYPRNTRENHQHAINAGASRSSSRLLARECQRSVNHQRPAWREHLEGEVVEKIRSAGTLPRVSRSRDGGSLPRLPQKQHPPIANSDLSLLRG